MKFLRAYPNLSSEAKLSPIGKLSRSVYVYRGRIHLVYKSTCAAMGARHDGLRVTASMFLNMRERVLKVINHDHRHL